MTKHAILERMQGYKTTIPRMKDVQFEEDNIHIFLEDDRIIISPLTPFPSIIKVPTEEREEYTIINEGTALNIFSCDEIFHVRDFLGLPEKWTDL